MLNDSPVSAIVPATDLARAKDFYTDKLGLKRIPMPMDDPMVFAAGEGTTIAVYHRAEGTKAEHTVAGFMVKDIDTTVTELSAKGVVFEDYNQPNLKTINHIVDYGSGKSAWFKDTEGNILAINQM